MHARYESDPGSLLAQAIAAGGRGVLFVGAHPDDESFALGGHLHLMPLIRIVIATDGAPRDLRDARKLGFADAESYAAARRHELYSALDVAGIGPGQLRQLEIPDQEAIHAAAEMAHDIAALIGEENTDIVLTHAYEGGHPDHDAVALAVHGAVTLLKGTASPAVVEMPYYRVAPDGSVVQDFEARPDRKVHMVELSETQLDNKRKMMSAHRTQTQLLGGFISPTERFRCAPAYDFTQPPNEGRLLYERWHLGITGSQWLAAARQALTELGPGQ